MDKITGIQFMKLAGVTADKKTELERCDEILRCVSDYSFSLKNRINHERLDKCIHLYKEERELLKSLDFLDKIISIYQPEQIKRVVAEPFHLDVEGVGIISKSDLFC
ncbi:MAG TPA: hypothetical protein PLW93_00210 [Candidatus Absconditabacterales bacterium]|nr:hypothetical protein [Candidatus Absconditabacterales bacterium]